MVLINLNRKVRWPVAAFDMDREFGASNLSRSTEECRGEACVPRFSSVLCTYNWRKMALRPEDEVRALGRTLKAIRIDEEALPCP